VKGLGSFDSWAFNDLHKYMDLSKLKVNSKLVASEANKYQKLSSFVKRKTPEVRLKKFVEREGSFDAFEASFFNN
jgi:hypothetical protein